MPRPTKGVKARDAERERMFAQAFVAMNFNGTQAAIAVGIPPAGAATAATRMLVRPHVAAMIAENVQALIEKHKISIDTTIAELGLIGFANIEDFTRLEDDGTRVLDLSNTTRKQLAAVASLDTEEIVLKGGDDEGGSGRVIKRKTKIKLHDKVPALVNLVKFLQGNLGRFDGAQVNVIDARQQINVAGDMNVNITMEEAEARYREFISKK